MRPIEERLVSSQQVMDGKLLKVFQDRVALPDGSVRLREVIRFPPTVGILPALPSERLLMIRQWRHAVGGWSYEIPGGKVDPGESSREAAHRELREETGRAAGWLRPVARFGLAIGYSSEIMTVYLAGELRDAPLEADEDELTEPVVLDRTAVLEAMTSGRIMDSKTVVALWLWLAMLGGGADPSDPTAPLPPGAGVDDP